MINDCAYVGENIIRYLPGRYEAVHIKRSRSLWGKTVGLFWRILRADGDLFHVHYLLQDAYLTLKLKRSKPVVAHAHGSDVRSAIHGRWGWMVRYSIEHADRVLLSAPDVLLKARRLRRDVTYIPIPVDLQQFTPQPFESHDRIVLLHPYASQTRGSAEVLKAFMRLEKRYGDRYLLLMLDGGITRRLIRELKPRNVRLFRRRPHSEMVELYRVADFVVTDMMIGALPTTSIEAMACGRPVIQYIKPGVYGGEIPHPPVLQVRKPDADSLFEVLVRIQDLDVGDLVKEGRRYVELHHDARTVAKLVAEVYDEVLQQRSARL